MGMATCIAASSVGEEEPKTLSLRRQQLSVLAADEYFPDGGLLAICSKTGPCPCAEPCLSGRQVLDDVLQGGWPVHGQPRRGCR